jgi:hypothetical protein
VKEILHPKAEEPGKSKKEMRVLRRLSDRKVGNRKEDKAEKAKNESVAGVLDKSPQGRWDENGKRDANRRNSPDAHVPRILRQARTSWSLRAGNARATARTQWTFNWFTWFTAPANSW